jgi:hypothetical protein
MKKSISFLIIVSIFLPNVGVCQEKPMRLQIVPESRSTEIGSISSGNDSKRCFYVVLTNLINKPQSVFEYWNSWGYQNISFEMTLSDGHKSKITMRDQGFTKNSPSTYSIPPDGHQVFLIIFNKEWDGLPKFKEAGQTQVKLKAIYSVTETPASKAKKIWTGTISSDEVSIELNHW